MTEVTTRRALEVCLSRLTMTHHARDTLAMHLTREIREATGPIERSAEALQADLQRIMTEANVDLTAPKHVLADRLQAIRAIVRGEA